MATAASTQVFGIAELLDMILLEYAASEQELKPFRPVTKLFVLQRVNHMFNDAIASSMVLRRAMFLEHADEEERRAIRCADSPNIFLDSDHNLAAVNWLFDTPPSETGALDFSWQRKPKHAAVPHSTIFKTRVFTGGLFHPTASWREMKMLRYPGPNYYRNGYLVSCRGPRLSYEMWEQFKGRETLGEYSGWIFEFLERSIAEHRVLSMLEDSEIRGDRELGENVHYYTPAEARDLLALLEDLQKDVGGGKGGKAANGKTKGQNKKRSSKKRHGRKSGKKQT
ncbi:uncharacterized protein RHO25_010885 [Cercospora beticola]|nr:hypothetical protein RHO25_010885 [Cercospora beticola]